MRIKTFGPASLGSSLLILLFVILATSAEGQDRGRRHRGTDRHVSVAARVSVTMGERARIREHYASHGRADAAALPRGIRKKLARGRPLPPGIAKRFARPARVSIARVQDRYVLLEVGFDVLLVETATGVVHDILMDVIR